MPLIPKTDELYITHLPALMLLNNLGWEYLSPRKMKILRKEAHEVVLTPILRENLKRRRFYFEGKWHKLDDKGIERLLQQVNNPRMSEGLIRANQLMYESLLYGISIPQIVDGRTANPTIGLIDWENWENNQFHMVDEFTLTGQNSPLKKSSVRPDIVLFVNGIPFAVIEAKRPASRKKGDMLQEGISQMLRNQQNQAAAHLFAYTQLLFSIDGISGKYGTTGTPSKFWAIWREEEISLETMQKIKNKPLEVEQQRALYSERSEEVNQWYSNTIAGKDRAVTEQDQLLISLLSPERLLEFTQFYLLFDAKNGKIAARYQQMFGVKAILARLKQNSESRAEHGGVIWHTTGSGKSYTMLMLSRALILTPELKESRVVVITDRTDLENQIANTFSRGGEIDSLSSAKIGSGRELAHALGKGNERIIFSLIQKFSSAVRNPNCYNESPNIIVLIDEGHRSQAGENHARMRAALPNAAFIAFTGTPLLKEDKTERRFGKILHAYTMENAVQDGAVTPLLYEERIPELAIEEDAIDQWFDRIIQNLPAKAKGDLKRKFAKKGALYKTEDRIEMIALDIIYDIETNLTPGLKAQLACDSKESAVRYQQFFAEHAPFKTALVISAPDRREGYSDIDESTLPLVQNWWEEKIGSQDPEQYTKEVIQEFSKDNDLKLLIVVDMLLTGFDEPRNGVLYIDKPLRDHGIIQAIARINRLHDKKEFGILVDYRGVLKELDTATEAYQNLAKRAQNAFDPEDIQGLYHNMQREYLKLPRLYEELWGHFKGVDTTDFEKMRQRFMPKLEERFGEVIDLNQEARDQFYEKLGEFATALKVALQSTQFFKDKRFTEEMISRYKETLKVLTELRQQLRSDSGESVEYDAYSEKIEKLLNKHVQAVDISGDGKRYALYSDNKKPFKEMTEEEAKEHETEIENELDLIKTRITRTLEEQAGEDPYAVTAFSKLLKERLKELEDLFDYPLKKYLILSKFEEEVNEKRLTGMPEEIAQNSLRQSYYGLLVRQFKGKEAELTDLSDAEREQFIELVLAIEPIVERIVAENRLNPEGLRRELNRALFGLMLPVAKSYQQGLKELTEGFFRELANAVFSQYEIY